MTSVFEAVITKGKYMNDSWKECLGESTKMQVTGSLLLMIIDMLEESAEIENFKRDL